MSRPASQEQPRKRGRKSGEEVLRQVALALKNIQELEWLEESPLGTLSVVAELAEGEYRQAIFPRGFALRLLLLEAVNRVREELSEMPRYQRELIFLQEFVQGKTVAEISRGLALSREHVTRTVQPSALSLVARMFLARTNEKAGRNAAWSAEIPESLAAASQLP